MALYVSLSFKQFGDDKLVTFSNTVYQHMSADTKYTTLTSFVADIKAKNDAFILGISNAAQGGKKLTDAKNVCREALLTVLGKVARRLEIMTEDNEDDTSIITDAGFEVRNTATKTRESVATLKVPVLKATNIDTKSVYATINWNGVPKAINYAISYKKKSETVWQNGIYNNKKEYTFTNLEPDTVYEFRIAAQGPDGVMSDMSAPVTIYVS